MNPLYERLLLYFDRDVLASYRQSPDRYSLSEDEMGGELSGDGIFLRFAFRRLEDRRVRIAVFRPDFETLDERDERIWTAFRAEGDPFAVDDPAFTRWTDRNFEASWEIEDGPIFQIPRHIKRIQAMTTATLGTALFKVSANPEVAYPAAENTHAYRSAVVAIYALVVDGLQPGVIAEIGSRLGVAVTDKSKTLNSLKQIVPPDLIAVIHAPLNDLRETRATVHGVPTAGSQAFPAFDTFHQDLVRLEAALIALDSWLEEVLHVSSSACARREEAMAVLFPKIVSGPRPAEKAHALGRSVGKTIESVRFGTVESKSYLHESEAIEIQFTDGTTLGISIGSNASNLASDIDGLSADDVHTDLMVFWAPSISGAGVDE